MSPRGACHSALQMLVPLPWWPHAVRLMTLGPTCSLPGRKQDGVVQCGDGPPSSIVECVRSSSDSWYHIPTRPQLSCGSMTWLWTCKCIQCSGVAEDSNLCGFFMDSMPRQVHLSTVSAKYMILILYENTVCHFLPLFCCGCKQLAEWAALIWLMSQQGVATNSC
jgi:hypothetical protein